MLGSPPVRTLFSICILSLLVAQSGCRPRTPPPPATGISVRNSAQWASVRAASDQILPALASAIDAALRSESTQTPELTALADQLRTTPFAESAQALAKPGETTTQPTPAAFAAAGSAELPHLQQALTCARAALLMAYSTAQSGNAESTKPWVAVVTTTIARLGSEPTIIERKAAIRELARAWTFAQSHGNDALQPELRTQILALKLDPKDLFGITASISFMGNVYAQTVLLPEPPVADVANLKLPPSADRPRLSQEILRVHAAIAAAWTQPDAAQSIAEIEKSFAFPECRPLASGYTLLFKQHLDAAEALRSAGLTPPAL